MPLPSPNTRKPKSTKSEESPTRADPPHRPVGNGALGNFALKDKDPSLHYVWASLTDDNIGVDYFSALGFAPVLFQPGGCCPVVAGALVQGDKIVKRGHLLMFCTQEMRQQIEQDGVEGGSGQRWLDKVESAMRLKNSFVDPQRGLRAQRGDQKYTRVLDAERFDS